MARFNLFGARTGSNGNNAGSGRASGGLVQRVYPYSLRWPLLFTSGLGLIWALAMGVNELRYRSWDNESGKQQTFDIIEAILYFSVAGIEGYCLFVAGAHNALMSKLIFLLAPIAAVAAIGVQILDVIVHFSLKGDKINQCVLNYLDSTIIFNGISSTPTNAQATGWCDDAWNRGTWSVFAWLIVVTILSFLFGSMALAYARQLADPSIVRVRNPRQPQAYPLQQQGGFYPPPPQQAQQNWMVPPYPGPPQDGSNPSRPWDKGDYQPQAEWANAEPLGYHAPSGPPPQHLSQSNNPFSDPSHNSNSARNVAPNQEEDEAWERARTEGVTAHLTGQRSPPPMGNSGASAQRGYRIGNDEEDEAWERARNEGVTAHLTGGGRKGDAQV